MKEVNEELAEKVEDLGSLEELNLTLITKVLQKNDELQEAHKELSQVSLITLLQ